MCCSRWHAFSPRQPHAPSPKPAPAVEARARRARRVPVMAWSSVSLAMLGIFSVQILNVLHAHQGSTKVQALSHLPAAYLVVRVLMLRQVKHRVAQIVLQASIKRGALRTSTSASHALVASMLMSRKVQAAMLVMQAKWRRHRRLRDVINVPRGGTKVRQVEQNV